MTGKRTVPEVEKLPADYVPAPGLLEGRVVLVTGAGDGIGRAVSLALARCGATVVLLGRTVRKLESVYDGIVAAGGPTPAIYPMDLGGAQPDHYATLAETVERELGRLDALLHNAGLLGSMSPVEHIEPLDWMRVMQVNVNAPFMLTRACLPLLGARDDASVVFTSSGVGRRGRAYWGAYAVSKFAIEGFAQVLADELETEGRVRVNVVNPGATRTAMRAAAYPGEDPATLKTPESIADRYVWLLGPDSRGVHGRSFDA